MRTHPRPCLSMFGLAMLACAAAATPAAAWTPPVVGQTCRGTRGGGPMIEAVAGNFLGARRIGHLGGRDTKSFQSCFRSANACENWLAHHAARYPVGPIIARCTRVVLR